MRGFSLGAPGDICGFVVERWSALAQVLAEGERAGESQEAVIDSHAESEQAERCNQCGQEVMEIDNRGMRLVGCLTCNLWAAADNERWIRLGEEDLRALHQLRHRGSR